MKCPNCPYEGAGECWAESAPQMCEWVDPAHPQYRPIHIETLKRGPYLVVTRDASTVTPRPQPVKFDHLTPRPAGGCCGGLNPYGD